MTARVQNSLREGNTLADFFTYLVFSFAGDFLIQHYQDILRKDKFTLELDRQGIPQIKRQVTGN